MKAERWQSFIHYHLTPTCFPDRSPAGLPADDDNAMPPQENSLRGLVRQLSIDQLDNEGRRVGVYDGKDKSPMFARSLSQQVRRDAHVHPSSRTSHLIIGAISDPCFPTPSFMSCLCRPKGGDKVSVSSALTPRTPLPVLRSTCCGALAKL
jgi:hypothetical protein